MQQPDHRWQAEHREQGQRGEESRHHGQSHSDVGADEKTDVKPLREPAAELGGEGREAEALVFAHVAPLVAVEDCRHQQPDRHRERDGSPVEPAGGREVPPDDHQRTHHQEHQRDSEGAVLVVQRRRRVEVAAEQPEGAEQDHPGAAYDGQVETDEDGHREEDVGQVERRLLADASFHDGQAGAGGGDRVDPMPDVVDLVHDVGPGVQEKSAQDGQQPGQQLDPSLRPGQDAAGGDRQHRSREAEGAGQLVDRAEPAPEPL